MNADQIKNTVVAAIARHAEREADIQMTSTFGDLGMDSLDVVEVLMEIEVEIESVSIKDDDWSFDTTVQQAVDAVLASISEAA